jgi:hypothetical protein
LQCLGLQERVALVDPRGRVGVSAVELVEGWRAERLIVGATKGEAVGQRIAHIDPGIGGRLARRRDGPDRRREGVDAVVAAIILVSDAADDLEPFDRLQPHLGEAAYEELLAAADDGRNRQNP